MTTPLIWNSQVQDQDIDLQQIVNNAVYLQYFDRARVQALKENGVDWEIWHHKGFNIVLVHTDMTLKKSLKADDKFYVKSTYEKSGKLKIIFHQEIYLAGTEQLVAKAINTLVVVDIKKEKPVMPEELEGLLF